MRCGDTKGQAVNRSREVAALVAARRFFFAHRRPRSCGCLGRRQCVRRRSGDRLETHWDRATFVGLHGDLRRATDRAEVPLDLASPAASPTTTPTAWSGCWSGPPDIRSPRPDPTWTPWGPDTRRADWDIDIEVEVGIDDIRDPNRQPRVDVHGRRWRKFAYVYTEVPVHARRARWRWWLSAADRW